jgi:hypothetical protein
LEPDNEGDGVSQNPFIITVTDYSNPWLSSYGTGLRTIILGYYAKFDVAWPVRDFEVGSPRLHISLGFDF